MVQSLCTFRAHIFCFWSHNGLLKLRGRILYIFLFCTFCPGMDLQKNANAVFGNSIAKFYPFILEMWEKCSFQRYAIDPDFSLFSLREGLLWLQFKFMLWNREMVQYLHKTIVLTVSVRVIQYIFVLWSCSQKHLNSFNWCSQKRFSLRHSHSAWNYQLEWFKFSKAN